MCVGKGHDGYTNLQLYAEAKNDKCFFKRQNALFIYIFKLVPTTGKLFVLNTLLCKVKCAYCLESTGNYVFYHHDVF